MSKAALLELADRVEKANGADTELDARIWCAVFAPADAHVEKSPFNGAWCIYHGVASRDPSRARLWEAGNSRVLPITSSLDAAMTLVPPGWSVKLYLHPGENSADLYLLGDYSDGDRPLVLGPIEAEQTATPALALTAASLRARAQQESKDA